MALDKAARAFVYCRISTGQQEGNSSIASQRAVCVEWCEKKGLLVHRVAEDEGVSGTIINRPALKQILAEMEPGDWLVVYNSSRFSRKVVDALTMVEDMSKKRQHLFFVVDNLEPTGSDVGNAAFMQLVFKSFTDEVYVRNVKEVTKRAMKVKRDLGEFCGTAAYGWCQKDGKKGEGLVEHPGQQLVISRMRALAEKQIVEKGVRNCAEIARILNDEGVKTLRGRLWTSGKVKNTIEFPGPKLWKASSLQCRKKELFRNTYSLRPETDIPSMEDKMAV